MNMQRVIDFSGGRTSAYMTITEYKPSDIVLFCDTGREHEKTYKFINDFEAFENIPVVRVAYPGGFERLLEKEKVIPNQWKRKCTQELKIRTARRYMRSHGFIKYEKLIGFRFDEPDRVNNHEDRWKQVITTFPLHKNKITKPMILDYWNHKPYNLQIPKILGNCTLCFMKGKNAIISILSNFPELADPWIADEQNNKNGHTYFKGITIKQMRDVAQNNLFKRYDLDKVNPDFNCACTT